MKKETQKEEMNPQNEPYKKENPHKGHRNRMRERFSQTKGAGMSEHEMLEMLLYYSIPQKNTNPIAHALIDRFGSIAGVFEASEDQLLMVDGISQNSVTLIKMIIPLFHEYKKQSKSGKRLKTADECGRFLCDYYSGIMKERVTVVCTDASCKVLAFETVCEGDTGSCLMNCRRLVEIVLKYPLTSAVIIAHNHPGGLALPSREDINATNELIKTMRSMNINIVDHIIVAGDEYVSMASSVNFKSIFR